MDREAWDRACRKLIMQLIVKGFRPEMAIAKANAIMVSLHGPQPAAPKKPKGASRLSPWLLVKTGIGALLRRKELGNYNYKKTLMKAAKYAFVVLVGSAAGVFTTLGSDQAFLDIFKEVPTVGPLVTALVVAGLKAAANFIKNKDK